MKALATLLVLAVSPTTLAAKPQPKPPVSAEVRADREEIGKLRRELMSAMVVKRLDLSSEQKRALLAVIADAKKLRASTAVDPDADAVREQRKALLRRAIEEARKTGEVSAETKAGIQELRADVKDVRKEHKGELLALKERLEKILKKEQVEELKELRRDAPEKRGKKGGKRMFLRLLMSDEFAAELAR